MYVLLYHVDLLRSIDCVVVDQIERLVANSLTKFQKRQKVPSTSSVSSATTTTTPMLSSPIRAKKHSSSLKQVSNSNLQSSVPGSRAKTEESFIAPSPKEDDRSEIDLKTIVTPPTEKQDTVDTIAAREPVAPDQAETSESPVIRKRSPPENVEKKVQKKRRVVYSSSDEDDDVPLLPAKPSTTVKKGQDYGEEVIGRRIRVYWPDDKKYYPGTIARFSKKRGHHIVYDDNDKEWLFLSKEKFQFLVDE